MTLPSLTGAEKTRLRGLGQTMADGASLGKDGVSAAFLTELNRQFATHKLVKLRFTGGQDRHERAALTTTRWVRRAPRSPGRRTWGCSAARARRAPAGRGG